MGRQNLDRYCAIQARVEGTIDLSHAASAQGRDDLIRPEFASGREGHWCAIIPPLR